MSTLTRDLKDHALELGFDLVGVAAAGPTSSAEHLERWLENGYQGQMDYMDETARLRTDPRLLLTRCRSLVMVAMSYRTSLPPSSAAGDGERVWVSRYAWGRDYHKVLKKKLIRLGRWLQERCSDSTWRAFVDSGPLLERAWAATAGLGWIGRNTQLINRRLGSELFLGSLLTDLRLDPDQPTSAHCGRCTACLEACPTSAFPSPGILDARRCVAYLTIEHRDHLPAKYATHLKNMVAGCDICQEVCPWNRRAPADLHPEFLPHPARYRPRLAELQRLDEDGFRRWREGSALKRIPYSHFRRCLEAVGLNMQNRSSEDAPKNGRKQSHD